MTSPPTPLLRGEGGLLTLALALEGKARADANGSAVALLSRDGATALNYTGLSANDATGRSLRAWLEMEGGSEITSPLRIRVDDTGARYPLTIDPFIQQAKLTAADGTAGDQLGYSVAVSADGSTIVAGAPYARIGSNASQGAAYVFVKPVGGWGNGTQTIKLTASDGAAGDYLGDSVAVSADGSTIVAGAPYARIGSNAS